MNICVVCKTAKLHVLQIQEPEAPARLARRDPLAWRELLLASEAQQRSEEMVRACLDALGIRSSWVSRDAFEGVSADVDAVWIIGGDGTVLDVSHRLGSTPVLLVNSDPGRSVGYYAACDASGVRSIAEAFLDARLGSCQLARMSLSLDGEPLGTPCLNDVLVANENPCMMSRYVLRAGSRAEKQSSSGIWISTPAGSTAGIRSAGGTVMPLEGSLLQYLVREPYTPRTVRYELLRGVRHLREGLSVQSLMQGGQLYVDGPWLKVPFGLGACLDIEEGPPLCVLGMDPSLRER